jgi:hypothetical protein
MRIEPKIWEAIIRSWMKEGKLHVKRAYPIHRIIVRRGRYSGLYSWGRNIIIRVPHPKNPEQNNLQKAKAVFFHEWGHYIQDLRARTNGKTPNFSQIGADKWAFRKTGIKGYYMSRYQNRYQQTVQYKQEAEQLAKEMGIEIRRIGTSPQGVILELRKGDKIHRNVGWGRVLSFLRSLKNGREWWMGDVDLILMSPKEKATKLAEELGIMRGKNGEE